MLNVKKVGKDSAKAEITLTNGIVLSIDSSRLRVGGFKIQDSSSTSGSFDIGYTTMKVCTLKIGNIDEKYSLYDFTDAVVKPYVINNDTLYQRGVYRVNKPTTKNGTITLTCYDDMYLLEKEYDGSILTPCTRLYAMQQIALKCGITLNFTSFTDSSAIISSIPSSVKTFRQLAGYIAQTAGSVLRQNDTGLFEFKDYVKNAFPESKLDGGDFKNYGTGDKADGGNFTDYTSGDSYDGGSFTDLKNVHHLYKLKNLTVSTDDIKITGISIKVDSKHTYTAGTDTYMLQVENNPLITTDNVQQVLNTLSSKFVGMRFRTLSGAVRSDFTIDAMDPAYVTDNKGNSYNCYITNVTYSAGSTTSVACDGKTQDDNKKTSSSPVTKLLAKVNEDTDSKILAYDEQMQAFQNLISMGLGLFKSQQKQADGSTIYYWHNKKTLAGSTIIWRMGGNVFTVSNDGGKTWTAGVDANGNVAVNVLSAIGINCSWLLAGMLTLGGINNGNGSCRVLDKDGAVIVSMDNTGAKINGGEIDIKSLNAYNGTETKITGDGFITKPQWGDIFDLTGSLFQAMAIYKTNHSQTDVATRVSSDYMAITKGPSYTYPDGAVITYEGLRIGNGSADISAPHTTAKLDGFYSDGSLYVRGSKHRVVKTQNYGDVLQNAVESPVPTFEDYGEGKLDEFGKCRIYLDSKFKETIDNITVYNVFLTKYGNGDAYISDRTERYFDVCGTANITFCWCLKATQKGFNNDRLEEMKEKPIKKYEEKEINYADVGAEFINDYEKEMLINENNN